MVRLSKWRFWPWIRDFGLVLLLVIGIRAYQQRGMPSGPAPTLSGVDLEGKPVSLASYRGRPVLLHFWATWCGVCKVEQPSIDAITRDLPVLSVATHSGGAGQVAAFARERDIAGPVVVDEDGEMARAFGVRSFPSSFVIDADGVIRHTEVGYTTELGLRARMWLATIGRRGPNL